MSAITRLGLICLVVALALWAFSFPLGVVGSATWIGGFSALNGAAFGTLLALATRTRRPLLIYGCVIAALPVLWPLLEAWPPVPISDAVRLQGAFFPTPYYFDILRFCLFVLSIPYPFARLGHHAPDPLT